MLVRFIAVALIGWAVTELALYWVVCRHDGKPVETLPCILKALPLLAGLVTLIKAKPIAEWVADKLDL